MDNRLVGTVQIIPFALDKQRAFALVVPRAPLVTLLAMRVVIACPGTGDHLRQKMNRITNFEAHDGRVGVVAQIGRACGAAILALIGDGSGPGCCCNRLLLRRAGGQEFLERFRRSGQLNALFDRTAAFPDLHIGPCARLHVGKHRIIDSLDKVEPFVLA